MFLKIVSFLLIINYCNTKCIDDYKESDKYELNEQSIECNVKTRLNGKTLNHFWVPLTVSTLNNQYTAEALSQPEICNGSDDRGYCTCNSPPDPHDNASDYMLSEDMNQNLALIGSLPHNGIKQIRIHFLFKLVSAEQHSNAIHYNFSLLDRLLTKLRDYGLKPGFELMGNPSNIFKDFENKTQVYQWKDLVKQTVSRYVNMFGIDCVKHWNFESWNEPSIEFRNHFNDKIKVTPKGFLNYYDACSQAIREVSKDLTFGGPGDHWPKNTSNGPFVIDLMKHYINGTNYLTGKKNDIKLDFISLHEKGNKGQTDYIDLLEDKALSDIQNQFSPLSNIPFVENEGDPEVGWNRNRTWRADNRYAATVVQVLARRIHNYNHTNRLSLYGFDNGFLSFYPFQFSQRTLLARFQINNTRPHFTQFVRKPAFIVMGLLAKLGNHLLEFSSNSSTNSSFNAIATAFKRIINNTESNDRPTDYSILFVNSLDTVMSNKTTSIKFNLDFNKTEITPNSDWKWSKYIMDNSHTNPVNAWTQHNCPDFPSDVLFAEMREQEEPHIEVNAQTLDPLEGHWNHTFQIAFPGISLIQICRKTPIIPEKLKGLRAIKIRNNSILLRWVSSNIRCLKTYELQYSKDGSNSSFIRLNKNEFIFPSFQYESLTANQTVFGFYRIRVIDFWNRKSQFSDVLYWSNR